MDGEFQLLIVDDNANNIYVLQSLLSKLPHMQMIVVTSGEEALIACMQRDIHLILLDVQMPVMDGYETARHLQMTEKTKAIPIVFLTAHLRSDAFIQQGYARGAVDYLTKPIDDNLLLNRVRHYQHLHDREVKLWERTQELQKTSEELQSTLNRLRATQNQLVQSEKLAALGRVVAVVAHELNTPIGNCLTAASTLDEKNLAIEMAFKSGEPVRKTQMLHYFENTHEAMELISRGLARAGQLVDNFKKLAIDQYSDARSRFELKPLLINSMDLLAMNFHRGNWKIDIVGGDDIWLNSYPGTLKQVLSILLENAIVHAFEGRPEGLVQIHADTDEPQYLLLHFKDDGCGMSEAVRKHIFDPFFTTRLSMGKSGLGMSICYNLIAGVLGGDISVVSVEGQGTEFMIRLPLEAPELVEA